MWVFFFFFLFSTHLELHGRVLLVLWRGVALVVEVVRGGRVNDGRLLRRLVETLTVDVDQEGQKPRPQETRHTGGDEVDGGERWETEKKEEKKKSTFSPSLLKARLGSVLWRQGVTITLCLLI